MSGIRDNLGIDEQELPSDDYEMPLREAALWLNVTPDALRGAIHRGRLRGRLIGPMWVVSFGALKDYADTKETWKAKEQVRDKLGLITIDID